MQSIQDLPAYYQGYLNQLSTYHSIEDGDVTTALGISYEMMMTLCSSIYEEQAFTSYQEGKWTIAEVFGHISDSERIFNYRALQIARGFQKEMPGYDQDEYVKRSNFNDRSFASLKAELFTVMESAGYLYEGFSTTMLDSYGTASNIRVTPRTIGMITAAHRVHHIHILKERYLNLNE